MERILEFQYTQEEFLEAVIEPYIAQDLDIKDYEVVSWQTTTLNGEPSIVIRLRKK